MNKVVKFLLIMLVVLTISGCKVSKTYKEITYNDYLNMVENKETFILFIGSTNCTHCDDFKKTVNKIMTNYDVVINYIDIAKMNEDDLKTFNSLVNYGGSTPTTIFIKNGKEENVYVRIVGALSYDKVVKKLKNLEYIK